MSGGNIDEAKCRLPLPALMHQLGLGEHAKKSARCPFHDDKHNSFSVWRNGAGLWFFKCHAGCGEGDEITFLELHMRISSSEAIKLFLEKSGVNGAASRSTSKPTSTLDWRECVKAFTQEHVERLAKWRGYSIEFCQWLKESGLVGLYDGCIAFPVQDCAGNVVAAHYRLKDCSWRYFPQGAKVRPLVIGELIPGEPVYVFESYWDAIDFLDKSGEKNGIVITRGAGNGATVSDLVPERSTHYVWTQNDPAGDKWQNDICVNTRAPVKRVKVPAPHKDVNDWMRGGGTVEELAAAMVNAEAVCAFESFAGSAGGQELANKKKNVSADQLASAC